MITNSRKELKFLIEEEVAGQVSRLASEFMRPDPYAMARSDWRYPVHSLYLDSPRFDLFWNTVRKVEPRLKLRIRYYDEDPGGPLFFEIKQRCEGETRKRRMQADREALDSMLAWPMRSWAEVAPEVQEFREAVREWKAAPVLHVSYQREPFEGLENRWERLTLDRRVRFGRPEGVLSTAPASLEELWPGKVVLELKFAGEMPVFFADLIRHFGLRHKSLSKYVSALRQLSVDTDLVAMAPEKSSAAMA